MGLGIRALGVYGFMGLGFRGLGVIGLSAFSEFNRFFMGRIPEGTMETIIW